MLPYEGPELDTATPRQYASVEDLARPRSGVEEEDYEVPGVGWIRIKGITRADFLTAQRRFGEDLQAQERFILSRSVIQPRVTEAIAGQWQEASGVQEINKLAMRINEMSGITQGADKSVVEEA